MTNYQIAVAFLIFLLIFFGPFSLLLASCWSGNLWRDYKNAFLVFNSALAALIVISAVMYGIDWAFDTIAKGTL